VSLADGPPASQSLAVSVDAGRHPTRVVLLLEAACGGAACAPSADDPASRLDLWSSPSGEFRVHYLQPPWELAEDGPAPLFRIRSNAENAGAVDGGPGKYELRVSAVSGAVPALMDAEVRAAAGGGRTIREGPRAVSTSEGVRGLELITFEPTIPIERYRRTALLPLPSGLTLRLAFEATPDLDTPEVDAMIAETEIGVRQ